MATRIRLTFADGSEETVRVSPRALIAAERHYGKDMPAIEGTFFAAYSSRPREMPFEVWLDTVDDFEEKKDTDPQAAASSETSPSLPPPSE